MSKQTPEQHAREQIANHAIEVIRDDGTYRHLRFRNPLWGSTWGFDLITWPQHLTIAGDLGVRTFLWNDADALRLFRPGMGELDYIAGKVIGGRRSVQEWSVKEFHEELRAQRDEWVKDFGRSADLDAAIASVIEDGDDTRQSAAESVEASVDGVTFEGVITKEDGAAFENAVILEGDDEPIVSHSRFNFSREAVYACTDWERQFIIQVTAIVLGVRMYDAHRAAMTTSHADRPTPVAA